MKKKLIIILSALLISTGIVGCANKAGNTQTSIAEATAASAAVLSNIHISSGDTESVGEANTYIELGSKISVNGEGVTLDNNKITITKGGTYSIKGTLTDGQIIVNAGDKDKVYIILNGANITCSNSAPIYVKNSKKTIIALAENTENYVKDGDSHVLEDESSEEPNAAIFSKSDLIFIGNGSLTVDGKYKNGITSKDDLKIQSGNIAINSKTDGLKGKDSVVITNGKITINSGEDGINSNNDEDSEKGYVLVEGGTINITSKEDGIQAETNAFVKDGNITINTGGGSENAPVKKEEIGNQKQETSSNLNTESEEKTSPKAIKANANIITEGGSLKIDSYDDALHSNNNLVINAGNLDISSGGKGIHSDSALTINNGKIDIKKSYEGLEGETITVNNGEIKIAASDDGINASSNAVESSGTDGHAGKVGSAGNAKLNINGGDLNVNADGDGLDANGSIYMKDGTVIVNGPTSAGNGALDYDGSFEVKGGMLITAGSLGMAQAPGTESTQNSIKVNLATQSANTLIHIESESGEEIVTFAPSKQYESVVVSSPNIKTGTTYKVYVGGSSTGTVSDEIYSSGTYTKGNEIGSVTISSTVTEITQEGVTASKGMGGGRGGMKGGVPRS